MTLHQQHRTREPDDHFVPGSLQYLVPGNRCRLLDGRRTPGRMESVDRESALFRWRIGAFEDEGKYWDLPVEKVSRFQFARDAEVLSSCSADELKSRSEIFQKPLIIGVDEDKRRETTAELRTLTEQASQWMLRHSSFLDSGQPLNLKNRQGPETLREDLAEYMLQQGLGDQEDQTAGMIVLNPESGEWIKGLRICMAEIGLTPFVGTVTRTGDVFSGMGAKENRQRYILHRMSFVQSCFKQFGYDWVVLYRGMASEGSVYETPMRSLLSWTFDYEAAASFADLTSGRFRGGYIIKRPIPISRLFMTYLETQAMNERYQEAEAVILQDERDLRV